MAQGFGDRLRRARKMRGLKQAELARVTSADQATICRYETVGGAPTVERLKEFAEALGVSFAWLAIGEGEDPTVGIEDDGAAGVEGAAQ